MFSLSGIGLPIDSWVFLPIMTGFPLVVSLKYFSSEGKFQGSLFLYPITLFSSIATIREIVILKNKILNSHLSLYRGMELVILKLYVLHFKVINIFDFLV